MHSAKISLLRPGAEESHHRDCQQQAGKSQKHIEHVTGNRVGRSNRRSIPPVAPNSVPTIAETVTTTRPDLQRDPSVPNTTARKDVAARGVGAKEVLR